MHQRRACTYREWSPHILPAMRPGAKQQQAVLNGCQCCGGLQAPVIGGAAAANVDRCDAMRQCLRGRASRRGGPCAGFARMPCGGGRRCRSVLQGQCTAACSTLLATHPPAKKKVKGVLTAEPPFFASSYFWRCHVSDSFARGWSFDCVKPNLAKRPGGMNTGITTSCSGGISPSCTTIIVADQAQLLGADQGQPTTD